jgi:hypothetical protein
MRHRGSRLAGGGYEGAALRRWGQVRREDLQGIGSGDSGAETLLEKITQE